MTRQALQTARILKEQGCSAAVINCSSIKPLDVDMLKKLSGMPCYTMEEHMETGGFGMYVAETCLRYGIRPPVRIFAVQDGFPAHGSHGLLMRDAGLDPETMAAEILHGAAGSGKGQVR